MKQVVVLLIGLFSLSQSYAQNVVTVKDAQTLRTLENVAIMKTDGADAIVNTNIKGIADISSLGNNALSFILGGYQTVSYSTEELKNMNYEVMLQQSAIDLNEIVISGSKFAEKKQDVSQSIEVISAEKIRNSNAQNTGDLLMQTGNVFVQKSQQGGSSPTLRGFEASRVLLVVDGIRMNNAIYRAGHLQNVITVDQNMLDRAEVIFGPGSVVYGSDALGGVMHFYTRKPTVSTDEKTLVTGNAFTRYSTANQEKTAHVDFNIGLQKLAFLGSVTYSDFGDVRQGNIRNPFYGDFGKRNFYYQRINGKDSSVKNSDFNLQVGSAYKQYDLNGKVLFKQSSTISHMLNVQYSGSSDVPRYDRLTEFKSGNLRYAEWYYGPQTRLLTSYHLTLSNANALYDEARVILSYQDIQESRNTRNFGSNNKTSRVEDVTVMALNADLMKKFGKQELRYGVEATQNGVTSTAKAVNIVTNAESPATTRYSNGGSKMTTAALYGTHSWEINDKMVTNAGIRFSYVGLKSNVTTKDSLWLFPFSDISQSNTALNGNLGFIYKPIPSLRVNAAFSSGFRAPNVDDLSKIFETVPGSVIVPNTELKPEYTYNAEIGIQKTFDNNKVKVGLVGFYTIFDNVIVTDKFTYGGKDSILYDGVLSKVTANQNKGEAYIYGTSFSVAADVTKAFSLNGSVNYTYGRVKPLKAGDKETPLDHIAPMFGRIGAQLNLKKFKGEFFTIFNGAKLLRDYSTSGEDNVQYATSNGMPAWYTLNLRASYQVHKVVMLQAGLENILDSNYRHFASGISAPGRNFYLALRANF